MSTRILQRRVPSHRRSVDPANPLYGFDYRPDWPSILSIAHDEADRGKLFVITDRPCILVSADLPLDVAGLFIVGAAACCDGRENEVFYCHQRSSQAYLSMSNQSSAYLL